jgi:anti-anti-sigma factor
MEQPTPLEQTDGFGVSRIPGGLAVSGAIDMATWAALAGVLGDLAGGDAAAGEVVLDLTEVTFIDSHGVELIAQAARGLDGGRRLVVRGAPLPMLRIADILHLDQEPRLAFEGPPA